VASPLRIDHGDAFDLEMAGELFERYLAVTVHQNTNRVTFGCFENQCLDDAMGVDSEVLGAAGGTGMCCVLIVMFRVLDAELAQYSYSRGNDGLACHIVWNLGRDVSVSDAEVYITW